MPGTKLVGVLRVCDVPSDNLLSNVGAPIVTVTTVMKSVGAVASVVRCSVFAKNNQLTNSASFGLFCLF